MMQIDFSIRDIDDVICQNIDLIDCGYSRGLVSQNVLSYTRDLVEHIAVKVYAVASNKDFIADHDSIQKALKHIKCNNKYEFIRKFHTFLQISKSHYTPDNEGAERLIIKYYPYYVLLKDFVKNEYQIDILRNISKIPINTDRTIIDFRNTIASHLELEWQKRDITYNSRMYINSVMPFVSNNNVYYEIILAPAYNTTSKFDRFVCYSKTIIPSHYSVKVDIYQSYIEINGQKIPINILVNSQVSIRPCELNNFAKILGYDIKISPNHSEYKNVMKYLSSSGVSLFDVVSSSLDEYELIKTKMFETSRTSNLEKVLDDCRELINANKPGFNVVSYLLHTLNNKIIKNQLSEKRCEKLSNLYLRWECIPFDEMPFASSLRQHNPEIENLIESINSDGRDHEFLARYIVSNTNNNSVLYTPIKDIEEYIHNLDFLISNFNSRLYCNHSGRKIKKYGKNLYIEESFLNTKAIIEKIQKLCISGISNYYDDVSTWLSMFADVDSDEKRLIIQEMFNNTKASFIYGSAGTGKTYLINKIADYIGGESILFLANTNPAVENLRRKVCAVNEQKCSFMTIKKFLSSKHNYAKYKMLVIDECSMVSNADMSRILEKIDCELMVFVGDVYQIESIDFGNWFSMAKYFIPNYSWHELKNPYRTNDKNLLEFWEKVRNCDDDLTEYIVKNKYSCCLNSSIFDKKSDDEIILCLNYDGLYGINNINKFLQESNPEQAYHWGLLTFKVGDPVLFNESNRFAPVLYNNLKGKIVNIEMDNDCNCIWFSIEIKKYLSRDDLNKVKGLQMLESSKKGKTIVKFCIYRKSELDDDNDYAGETDIPFQVAYAVSIHKSQGLEYESVKIVITQDVNKFITHNIFYTAITRSKRYLKIYWSPETQEDIIKNFKVNNIEKDVMIFANHSGIKAYRLN